MEKQQNFVMAYYYLKNSSVTIKKKLCVQYYGRSEASSDLGKLNLLQWN